MDKTQLSEKTPLWMAGILLLRVLPFDAARSAAVAVCGEQQGQTKTASSVANERWSSREASKDVARFRELNTKPAGASSNYKTNLFQCIQLIF